MAIYIIVLILLNIGFFLDIKKIEFRKIYFYMSSLILFLISSLRYGVGQDYKSYEDIFLNIEKSKINSQFITKGVEIGYLYMTLLIKNMVNQYQIQLILMNIFIFIFLFKSILKIKYRNISLFVLYTFLFLHPIFNMYRQGLIMICFLYNIDNIEKKRKWTYIIISIIGGMFHITSFLTIPFYFILKRKYSLKTYFSFLVISILLSNPILINSLMKFLINNFNNPLTKKLNVYFFIKSRGEISNTSLIAWANRTVQILWLALFYYIKKGNFNRKEIIVFNTFYLAVVSFIILSPVGVVAGRISDIFEVSLILFVPLMISRLKRRKEIKKIFIIQSLIYFNIFFIKELNTNNGGHKTKDYLPYKSILQKE